MAKPRNNAADDGAQAGIDTDADQSNDAAAQAVEADVSGLIRVSKPGEIDIYIHPSTVKDHARCGWKVAE